ncbi:HDIG domain-containing protein [bacterium]|nr:HDIG domain-containing protein [bacterium]
MRPALTLPTPALYILHRLQAHGFAAYLIGGSVRDVMANALGYYQTPKNVECDDFDYTTNAVPEQTMTVFPRSFYKNQFGTVSVTPADLRELMGWPREQESEPATRVEAPDRIPISQATRVHESLQLPTHAPPAEKLNNFEITTFRVGEKYETNNRQPSHLEWGTTIEEDLTRRDFTINALALSVKQKRLEELFATTQMQSQITIRPEDYQLIDRYQGLDDLRDNLVATIGDPDARFQEDALRLMRAVRLSVQLNFAIEEHTYAAIQHNASLLATISKERVRDEFLKILASSYPKEGIMLLDETGLLPHIVPELLMTKGVEQSGHHLTDVWVHSLDALAACPNPDPIVRLATLLHDIGKPQTQAYKDGQYTFYNHQVVGAHLARRICRRLKLSREQTTRVFLLVRHHMFHYLPENTDASIRRFMRQVGLENLNDILDLREADRLGSNARKTSWRLEEMKARMIEQLHQPMQVRDLAIGGYDLMTELSLTPGPILGQILNTLLEEVLEDSSLNERDRLLARARELARAKH